jgi:hypothetical protein
MRDAIDGVGVEGASFPTWSSSVALQARIIANFGQGPVPWGPIFPLNPAFSEKAAALLGRQDFFQAFTVTFAENAAAPAFHLDY